MSDIYIPGVNSRFNTDQTIERLMQVERIPRDRAEGNVSRLELEKSYWQEIGRRMTTLRESARAMYSFQNPFNDRIVNSSNESVLTGTAVREALEQERNFTVKQIAQADRFLSNPLDESYRVESGNYTFTIGSEEISFDFRGGTLREFVDTLNRRGQDKIQASLIAVRPGTRSLLIESLVTGEENRMTFSGAAENLGRNIGMIEPAFDNRLAFNVDVKVNAGEQYSIPLGQRVTTSPNLVLTFETATEVRASEAWVPPQPPPGPSIPSAGSISYGGIVIENEQSSVAVPPWNPPEAPRRVDDMSVVSLSFSDGTSMKLPAITDSGSFGTYQFNLDAVPSGKNITSINLVNNNTHRDVSIRNIQIYDPETAGGVRPLNAVSRAQDAIITMEGIEIRRPTNAIDDLIPGVTLNLKAPSDRPVNLQITPDRESVKDAIITFVGHYNRLMAEINVLTRTDSRVVDELTYLSREGREEYLGKLGTFQTDSTLNQFRNVLQRTITTPYPTYLERDLILLSQIGIGTGGASTGYDPSRLRGYLEIDERVLDAAIMSKLMAIKEIFASDTDGDLAMDTGIAYNLERLILPSVQTGGLISLKTGTVDSRISQETRRIETMDRQLAAKEAELRVQYAQMENAYNRMESMSQTLNNFSQQNNYNNNR
jgi:flagellar hook-associated protein 2